MKLPLDKLSNAELVRTVIDAFATLYKRQFSENEPGHDEVMEAASELRSNKELRLFVSKCLGFNADNLNEMYEFERLNALLEGRCIGQRLSATEREARGRKQLHGR